MWRPALADTCTAPAGLHRARSNAREPWGAAGGRVAPPAGPRSYIVQYRRRRRRALFLPPPSLAGAIDAKELHVGLMIVYDKLNKARGVWDGVPVGRRNHGEHGRLSNCTAAASSEVLPASFPRSRPWPAYALHRRCCRCT